MVDIFEIAPSESSGRTGSNAFAYSAHGARMARYQHLVSKLNSDENDTTPAGVKVDWLADEAPAEGTLSPRSANSTRNDDGPLVGTFADAAAAMK